jgi:hypothetical protein
MRLSPSIAIISQCSSGLYDRSRALPRHVALCERALTLR